MSDTHVATFKDYAAYPNRARACNHVRPAIFVDSGIQIPVENGGDISALLSSLTDDQLVKEMTRRLGMGATQKGEQNAKDEG